MEKFATLSEFQAVVREVLKDGAQTYEQQTYRLAKLAENSLPYPVGEDHDFFPLYENGSICDLDEGHGPYAPRYILPDYEKFLREGSAFLRLEPARDLLSAVTQLLILYHHVPSITRFPVYIGSLDRLLEPFVQEAGAEAARPILKNFLLQLDRTVDDSFCHGNLGPKESLTGRLLLELLPELQIATPNMTLLYDPQVTPDDFAALAVKSSLTCANPAFANHPLYEREYRAHGSDYGIASCYNALPYGGGAYTLSRLRLNKIAQNSASFEDFMEEELPRAVTALAEFMEAKIDFLKNESAFFQHNFLVKEGLIHPENFVGLFGVVGIHECVAELLEKRGEEGLFGTDKNADDLAVTVLERVEELVAAFTSKHSGKFGHRFILHAQVGAAGDQGTTAAHRIQIGKEPDLYTHIRQTARLQPFFPSGVGDHFPFDETARENPQAVLDIFKAGFALGNRYLSAYNDDGDLIRVTGYLVKKSDVEKFARGEQVHYDTVQYAQDPLQKYGVARRKVEAVE